MKMKFSNIILVSYLSVLLIGAYLVMLGARSYSRQQSPDYSEDQTSDNSLNMSFYQPVRHIVAKNCDLQLGVQLVDGKELRISASFQNSDGSPKREPIMSGDTLFIQDLNVYQLVLNAPLLSFNMVDCEMSLTTDIYPPNGNVIYHLERSFIDFHSADAMSKVGIDAVNSTVRYHCEGGFTDSVSVILRRSSFFLENQNAEGKVLGHMDIQYVPSEETIHIPSVYLPRTSFTELKR